MRVARSLGRDFARASLAPQDVQAANGAGILGGLPAANTPPPRKEPTSNKVCGVSMLGSTVLGAAAKGIERKPGSPSVHVPQLGAQQETAASVKTTVTQTRMVFRLALFPPVASVPWKK